jgi:hypothetical protein
MKIDHCHGDVHTCAKIDLGHCKKIKHKCVVKSCKSMAGHYVYNVYKTHCYRHSTGDYVAYIASQEHCSIIPPVEINHVVIPIVPVVIKPSSMLEAADTTSMLEAEKNKQFNPDDLFI